VKPNLRETANEIFAKNECAPVARLNRFDIGIGGFAALVTFGVAPFQNSPGSYFAAIAVASLVVGLANPRLAWMLYVLAACSSGIQIAVLGPTFLPEHVALVPLAVHALRQTKSQTLRRRPALAVVIFALVMWLGINGLTSIAESPETSQSLRLLLWTGANIVAAALVVRFPLPAVSMARDALTVIGATSFASSIMWLSATLSSTQSIFVEQDYASEFFRLKGLMLEPNILAALLFFGSCVVVRYSVDLPKIQTVAFLTIASLGIALTFTRVSGLMMAVLLVVFLWPRLSAFFKSLLVLGAIASVIVLSAPSARSSTEDTIVDVLAGRVNGILDFDSGTGAFRARTAGIAWEEIVRRGPLIGQGFNTFPQIHESDQGSKGELYLGLLWLVLVYDGGVIGAIFFIIAVLAAWKAIGFKNGALFMGGFAVIATTTNPIWYAFPWILATVLALAANQHGAGQDTSPRRKKSGPDALSAGKATSVAP
jgi:hypothetical protein